MTSSTSTRPVATPGSKMMFLIRRKPTTSRDELIAHWFANHMGLVIERQHKNAAAHKPHARRYLVTLFRPDAAGAQPWDGVAQLWWDRPLPKPAAPFGDPPTDSFQERAEPYTPWATTEYVITNDASLASTPLTLNAPYPTTRSGFFKAIFLVKVKRDADMAALFAHWLGVHAPNVAATMAKTGGLRYVVSHSLRPADEPYVGMAELYFPNEAAWLRFRAELQSDGMEQWVDPKGTVLLTADTEFIGIP